MTDTMTDGSQPLAPVRRKDRIQSLDVVRGLAILGILAVNAAAFAYPFAAYADPALAPFPLTGNAAVAEWVVATFFHTKFVTMFSLLFGASIFLVGGERADRPRGRVLLRRLLWLIVIGLIHGIALWYGDILLLYGVAGLVVMLLRSMKPRMLIGIGLGVTLLLGLVQAAGAIAINFAPPDVQAHVAAQRAATGSAEMVLASIQAYRGGWPGGFLENLHAWTFLQQISLTWLLIPTIALMMLGMGLLKSGFLSGKAPTRLYAAVTALGAVVLAGTGALEWIRLMAGPGGDPTHGLTAAIQAFPVLITLGYASALILLTTRGARWATAALAPVGQMAFTNYLTQTLIMASLFTLPWGPRLSGSLDRPALWGIVGIIWVLQLIWSPLWLSRFTMGPLEWIWRSLTYGRRLPLTRSGA